MKNIAEIIKTLNDSQINIVLLCIGLILVILGTTRFKRLKIIPQYRKLLNAIAIAFLLSGLVMSIWGAL